MIFILGCDHYLQEYNLEEPSQALLDHARYMKGVFYQIVQDICKEHSFSRIGEECKKDQVTIPRAIANELGICHLEIDMTDVERIREGIASDYQRQEGTKATGYEKREEYMMKKALSGLSPGENLLLVCGANHLNGLRTRSEQVCNKVEVRDLTQEPWFVEAWKKRRDLLFQA